MAAWLCRKAWGPFGNHVLISHLAVPSAGCLPGQRLFSCSYPSEKNILTKGGYTPYQLAFGRAPLFPDLLEEDMHGNLALRESLSTEGEVLRTAEMRAAARAALLRQDTLDNEAGFEKLAKRRAERIQSWRNGVFLLSQTKNCSFQKRWRVLEGSGSNFDEGVASAILFVMAWQVSFGFCTQYSPCHSARG